jgi:hypothetical protein
MMLTVPGWKSDIEKQIFLSIWKRPDGVNILKDVGSVPLYSTNNAANRYLDTRRLEWVFWREHYDAMVLPTCVWTIRRSALRHSY